MSLSFLASLKLLDSVFTSTTNSDLLPPSYKDPVMTSSPPGWFRTVSPSQHFYLITSAKSFLPCKITYSQVSRIRTWTSWRWALFHLPQVESVLLLKEGKWERISGNRVFNAWHTVDARLILNEGMFGGIWCAAPLYHPEIRWFNQYLFIEKQRVSGILWWSLYKDIYSKIG